MTITMAYKFFLYLVLIALYIYFFGLSSFNRYKEESIVTINKILPISSREISRKPGIKYTLEQIFNKTWKLNVKGLTIIPRDPTTNSGWKNTSFDYLSRQTGARLQKGLENHAYMYDEIVIDTKYPVGHEMKIANTQSGLIQLLDSPSEHFTFSPETSQIITLNGSRGYFVSISDPGFSVASANPETIPRTLINLAPGGGTVQIYLTVKTFNDSGLCSTHKIIFSSWSYTAIWAERATNVLMPRDMTTPTV